MKKHIFSITAVMAVASLVFFACKKKQDDTIYPTYKEEATGTASNPNPNNVTVTGTTTATDPATQNSSIMAGGAGWSNPSCASTNSLYIKGINGATEITVNFAAPPAVGPSTYQIGSTPGLGSCALTVIGAPDQPTGTVWYGYKGSLSVLTNTYLVTGGGGTVVATNITANVLGDGVSCHQSTFNFPIVTVRGSIGCN